MSKYYIDDNTKIIATIKLDSIYKHRVITNERRFENNTNYIKQGYIDNIDKIINQEINIIYKTNRKGEQEIVEVYKNSEEFKLYQDDFIKINDKLKKLATTDDFSLNFIKSLKYRNASIERYNYLSDEKIEQIEKIKKTRQIKNKIKEF